MRRHHHGRSAGVDFFKNLENFFGVFRVQVSGRFVRQKQIRIVHHGTRNRYTLLFTARKRIRHRKAFLANAHERQGIEHRRIDLLTRGTHDTERQRHIFKNIAVW